MARLFVSQDQMDDWLRSGKVELDGEKMAVPAKDRRFDLASAVCFTQMVDGADQKGLLGRVKTIEQLTALGAEYYGTSVILGESGYECVEGFVCTPIASGGASSALAEHLP